MFKIIAVHFTFVFILLLSSGCEENKNIEEGLIAPKCIPSQNDCFVKSASGNFSVLFNRDPIVTETPFDVFLMSDSSFTIKKISAHLEGKNMFMGKIPLFFDEQIKTPTEGLQTKSNNNGKLFSANTMLGSCSEETMRWIIYFTVDLLNENNEKVTEKFTVEFDSTRI